MPKVSNCITFTERQMEVEVPQQYYRKEKVGKIECKWRDSCRIN